MTGDNVEIAIKAARDCHTKAHWDDFLQKFGDTLSTTTKPRIVLEVFRKLKSDPQSLYYNPKLWSCLLQGAMASWNLDIGIEIVEFSKKLTLPIVSIPAAQTLLEAGKPSVSREFAQRALRLSAISELEKIQLELIVASSFAEEGKTEHAVRVLNKVSPLIRSAKMSQKERADFDVRRGRLQFFMGRYPDASEAFLEAAPILLELEDWEGAAKALFNAAACTENGFNDRAESTLKLVEQCRKLSVEHNLNGPLSHCEAFFGFRALNIGNFMSARDHFRRALTLLPASDNSYRRLHVMSMLSLTYFSMGRYPLAIKIGRQTLDLAALDTSDRAKSRYKALEAEILWEEGKILESIEVLKEATHQLELQGVRTLEDLSALAKYQVQVAILGGTIDQSYKLDESLKNNQPTWLEYIYSCALLKCRPEQYDASLQQFEECLKLAHAIGSRHYPAFIYLGMIRLHLQRHDALKVAEILPKLENAVRELGDTPIGAKLQFVYAGIAYQSGDFNLAVKHLQAVEKMTIVSWPDRFAATACLATIRGESPRFQFSWQEKIMARFVRSYFAPTMKIEANRVFKISNHYDVNLDKHPAMADLIVYLSERVPNGATLSEIQTNVWKESLNTQGWQQKIRNAVMRVRDHFPYTIAPILVHSDTLRFFGEAIRVVRNYDDQLPIEEKVRVLLNDGPMSSQQVSEKIDVSLATAKRLLKKMSESQLLIVEKSGRNVMYHTNNLYSHRPSSAKSSPRPSL